MLKAIETALSGKFDESHIRVGSSDSSIELDLEAFKVKRTMSPAGMVLSVTNPEGYHIPKPQSFLDGIIGQFAFNPIEFFNQSPKDRKKYLLQAIDMKVDEGKLTELLGMNLTGIPLNYDKHALEVINDAHKIFYEQRTGVNASVTKKKKSIDQIRGEIPEGFDPASVSEEKIAELRQAITDNEVSKSNKENLSRSMVEKTGRIATLKQELNRLERDLEEDTKSHDAIILVDTSELETSLKNLEAMKETAFKQKQVDTMRSDLVDEVIQQEKLDATVKALSKDIPDKLLAEAKLPIDGLVIEGDSIKINGVDLENLSTSEQILFGLTVVKSLNDKFKVVCIDGLEALDAETLQWFLGVIADDDYQYFMTTVGQLNGATVMEDGAIKTNATNS